MVVEPGRLAGQPADQPQLKRVVHADLLVPAPLGIEADPGHPFGRGGGQPPHLGGERPGRKQALFSSDGRPVHPKIMTRFP